MMDEPTIGRDSWRDRVGPLIIAAGVVMLALALLGKGAHHPSVAEPQPSVTVTTTPKPSKHSRPRAHASQSTKPRQTGGGGRASDGDRVTAVAAGAPKTSHHGSGATSHRPGAVAPSAPAPRAPANEQPADKSCALGVSVLLLDACLNLGDAP